MYIDTHCHLTDGRFAEDLDEVVIAAQEAGIEKIIVPAVDLADSGKVVALTQKYEGAYGLVGIYPGNVDETESIEEAMKELEGLLKQERVVGIGEIGMDGYWKKDNLEKQREVFTAQLRLASLWDLPVVIHSRAAGGEIRAVLESFSENVRGQFHCFGEDEDFLAFVLDRGFYVSFCGNVTYRSAEKLRELSERVPLTQLLVETDAPYLAPEGKRGERNVPANVKITAEFLAKVRGISSEELARVTTENARKLFNLPTE